MSVSFCDSFLWAIHMPTPTPPMKNLFLNKNNYMWSSTNPRYNLCWAHDPFPIISLSLHSLSKLVHLNVVVGLMLKIERLKPFRRPVIVVSLHECFWFLEADVVEAGKRGTVNIANRMIGHKEVLLPSHEYKVTLLQCIVAEVITIESFLILFECTKSTLKNWRQVITITNW